MATTTSYTAVDLDKLPAPSIVEPLDFETIFSEMLTDLQGRDATFSALVESDPAYKILEVASFRELLIRQRVNEAAKGVMLGFAEDSDLDQIGGNYNVRRLVLDAGDPSAVPPREPVFESNGDYRKRIQLSLEGKSTAGPEGAYIFHALSANSDVKDAKVHSPSPGEVVVTLLSRTSNGVASDLTKNLVLNKLSADDIRPLTDSVSVQSATIINYSITAVLRLFEGPDATIILQAANESIERYVAARHALGLDVSLSGIYAALHVEGVESVALQSPLVDIPVSDTEAAYCETIAVSSE